MNYNILKLTQMNDKLFFENWYFFQSPNQKRQYCYLLLQSFVFIFRRHQSDVFWGSGFVHQSRGRWKFLLFHEWFGVEFCRNFWFLIFLLVLDLIEETDWYKGSFFGDNILFVSCQGLNNGVKIHPAIEITVQRAMNALADIWSSAVIRTVRHNWAVLFPVSVVEFGVIFQIVFIKISNKTLKFFLNLFFSQYFLEFTNNINF